MLGKQALDRLGAIVFGGPLARALFDFVAVKFQESAPNGGFFAARSASRFSHRCPPRFALLLTLDLATGPLRA